MSVSPQEAIIYHRLVFNQLQAGLIPSEAAWEELMEQEGSTFLMITAALPLSFSQREHVRGTSSIFKSCNALFHV